MAAIKDPENTLIMETTQGKVVIALRPDLAPKHVERLKTLAREGFYDGIVFHRVIDDFMAQGGDPLGSGFGGPGYSFDLEIAGETHSPGTLSYANTGQPNSNGSQFFIVAETGATFLDGDYTIFGRCEPVSVVQAITEVATDANDEPLEPIHMQTVSITRCAP